MLPAHTTRPRSVVDPAGSFGLPLAPFIDFSQWPLRLVVKRPTLSSCKDSGVPVAVFSIDGHLEKTFRDALWDMKVPQGNRASD